MKRWVLVVMMTLYAISAYAQTTGMEDLEALSPEDRELLGKAVGMVDMGLSEAVIPDFDYLAETYPDNYLVQYERYYNLYKLGMYDKVLDGEKSLLRLKNSDPLLYQMLGNAYDITGDRRKAEEMYRAGLQRFPDSGLLLMEMGTLYLLDGDYNTAIEYYNRGIVAQPNFASNYYRAALLYLASENGKVWGLVYAESAILLAPSNASRHKEMAQMMAECLKENIHISYGPTDSLSVRLVPQRDIRINQEDDVVFLGFPGVYEGALSQPLNRMFVDHIPFTGDLVQLIQIRKGMVETYFSVTDNLFGDSMYLLEFQKRVIDAGHWDAYNYYLFMSAFPEEFEKWYSSNAGEFDDFIEWYNASPYRLGDGRSVDPAQIYNSYRPINLLESMMIQGRLLIDKPDAQ